MLFRLVRFPNLLIVALTQYFLQYLVLVPAFHRADLSPTLSGGYFLLFVVTTMLIAAGGYIINDIEDYQPDLVNKPEKVFVGRAISKKNAWQLFAGIFLIGLAAAVYLAFHVKNPPLALIYPAAAGLLAAYSLFLKKIPLAGNVAVALFCAFVPGVVLFAERQTFGAFTLLNPKAAEETRVLFGGYLLFAFLSTMLREIVKDMEDVPGDRLAGHYTLPIAFGMKAAKWGAAFFSFMLLIMLALFSKWLSEKGEWLSLAFCFAGVVLPLGYCLWLLARASTKTHFSRLSRLTKLIMVGGLALLLLL